jgi:hypothetical protein
LHSAASARAAGRLHCPSPCCIAGFFGAISIAMVLSDRLRRCCGLVSAGGGVGGARAPISRGVRVLDLELDIRTRPWRARASRRGRAVPSAPFAVLLAFTKPRGSEALISRLTRRRAPETEAIERDERGLQSRAIQFL